MNMTGKIGWALAVVLAAGLGWMSYTFLVRGNVEASEDGRTTILLLPGEVIRVKGDMRGFLETVQSITEAAAQDDMASVIETATNAGMAATGGANAQLIAKLPLEFRMLGMGTHQAFDNLATLAAETDDGKVVLARLGDVLLNCTACHASYRLGVETADGGN